MYNDGICERIDLCKKGENPYLIHEFENSYFVVGDHQFYKGYSLILFKECVRELHDLEMDKYLGLSKELYLANQAVTKTFSPWKINNQCLGNQDQHIHWHILPRYEDDKYHKTLPMTDYVLGEIDLRDYAIDSTEAKRVASLIRENLLTN